MKKFQFSLERLLRYKGQVFSAERMALSNMLAVLAALEKELDELIRERAARSRHLSEIMAQGITAIDMEVHKNYLIILDNRIEEQRARIELQTQAVEKQQDKVREAKAEIATIEKLRENRLEEHRLMEAKEQELLVDEFVSHRKAAETEE